MKVGLAQKCNFLPQVKHVSTSVATKKREITNYKAFWKRNSALRRSFEKEFCKKIPQFLIFEMIKLYFRQNTPLVEKQVKIFNIKSYMENILFKVKLSVNNN